MTVREFTHKIEQELTPLYGLREASAIARYYMQSRLQVPNYKMIDLAGHSLTDEQVSCFERDLLRLKKAFPLQYVLGEAEFCGLTFAVTPDVLIPRPETEELVVKAIEVLDSRNDKNANVWDVGTGSGCIAVSIAKQRPEVQMFATDLSESALQTARRNAERHEVEISFAQHNMLDADNIPFGNPVLDMLVSNPPYIPNSVRSEMHRNVVDYEPGEALFVPDEDSLLYYRPLAILGRKCLKQEGVILAETYDNFHPELRLLFEEYGYSRFESMKDINDRDRMILVSL